MLNVSDVKGYQMYFVCNSSPWVNVASMHVCVMYVCVYAIHIVRTSKHVLYHDQIY
jgi:hypothetical protein